MLLLASFQMLHFNIGIDGHECVIVRVRQIRVLKHSKVFFIHTGVHSSSLDDVSKYLGRADRFTASPVRHDSEGEFRLFNFQ